MSIKTTQNDIENKISEIDEFLDNFGYYIDENFKIPSYQDQKTSIKEWKKVFNVTIPTEINFPILVSLAAEVATKFQQASFFRDRQQIQLAMLEQQRNIKYIEAYNKARRDSEAIHKKQLAAESCRAEATQAVKELDEAINSQKVIKDFWQGTCNTLTELRKILEVIGYALGGDARVNKEFNVKGN